MRRADAVQLMVMRVVWHTSGNLARLMAAADVSA